MVELRARKPSAAKATTTTKAPSKRKAAPTEDVSASAPKKVKEDTQAKKTKRSDSVSKSKNESKSKKQKPTPVDDASDESESEQEKEQNAEGEKEARALAKIVDSDAEKEDEEGDDVSDDEDGKDLELPKVPEKTTKPSESSESEPGVVYIGRIPRGFYEHQMREYFSQFGQVNRLRMSRNKATGRSKHFAFIEFAEHGVAEIVAKTMDNYLLAGHILKVKMVPKSQIHEKLWIGANKRFKKVPWNKMAGNRLKKPLTESGWTARISKEEQKRKERAKKLSELGYEFEAPKLKTIEDLKETPAAIEAAEDENPKAIEAAPTAAAVEEKPTKETQPAKKAAKSDKKAAATKSSKKVKKGKKASS
ncbi:RNA-binding domain-containing protein [Xylariaceae sp. FL0594]|nr:RNA-binding domain-containing protein [Xylariaceae sp. FL0594]